MEKCENCEKPIGKLETPNVWRDRVVCAACHAELAARSPIPYASPATPRLQTFRMNAIDRSGRRVVIEHVAESYEAAWESAKRQGFHEVPAAPRGDDAEMLDELRGLRRQQHNQSVDAAQRLGCLVFLAGVAMLCFVWPVGIVLMIVGLVWSIVNTRLR